MTLSPPMTDAELWAEAQRRLVRRNQPAEPRAHTEPLPAPDRGTDGPQARPKATRKPRATRQSAPKRPAPLERDEQADLIARCDAWAGHYPELAHVYAIANAGGYSGGFASNARRVVRALREGVRKGYPDLGLDVARGPFHGLRIELKRQRGGSVEPEQRAWHDWLRAQGYRVDVCKGADAAWAVLLDYLGVEDVTDAAA